MVIVYITVSISDMGLIILKEDLHLFPALIAHRPNRLCFLRMGHAGIETVAAGGGDDRDNAKKEGGVEN